MSSMIKCRLCGEATRVVEAHLKERHPDVAIGDYLKRFPKAPIFADGARGAIAERTIAEKVLAERAGVAAAARRASTASALSRPLHEVFGLGAAASARGPQGEPIPIRLFEHGAFPEVADFVPEPDPNYVHSPHLLRTVMLGIELDIPVYLWGHAGAGKSSAFEQVCARTRRPFLRVQHTANMEESQVIGQYVFRDGQTMWEDGPLPFAMRHGMLYMADEYDFALPHVLSLYQPALEGKPLVIKEAPPELRVVRRHPEFRLCATGNTNGAGDDTGLYQGTTLQNFANYERFGVVERVDWLRKPQEVKAICAQTGVAKAQASKLVDFAVEIRRAHDGGKLGATLSLRAMIHAARIFGRRADWRAALALAFVNRLNATDREVCEQIAQRHFG